MPATPSLLPAKYSVLSVALPGGDLTPIGILLEEATGETLHLRLRRDWDRLADPDDAEVLEAMAGDLAAKADAGDLGTEGLFHYLEDNLSNVVQISDRQATMVEHFDRALNRLYRENVQSNVVPFRTHLPLYSLRVAAGKFLENEEVVEEAWLEMPYDLRLAPEMFVARIAGHSMEPLIADGSVCVFRHGVAGSREGRLVLVEDLQTGGNNRYTVKRYRSSKETSESGWKHNRIRLESLNPEYPSWDLHPDEEKYRILAEFVKVVE